MDTGISVAASRLRLGVIVVLALIVLLFVLAQLGVPIAGVEVQYRASGFEGAGARLTATIGLALLCMGGLRLVQMLGRIAAGELFTAQVIGRFRGFAFWLLMMALFGFAARLVAGLAGGAPGIHLIAVRLDSRELLILGITLVLFLIARLLERASEIEAEMREFV